MALISYRISRVFLYIAIVMLMAGCAQTSRQIGLAAAVADNNEGIRIINVQPDTPADILGLEKDDIILEFGNRPLKGMALHEFVNLIQSYETETSVPIRITRKNNTWNGKILMGLTDSTMIDYYHDKRILGEVFEKKSTDAVEKFILDNPKSLVKRLAYKGLVEMGETRADRDNFYRTLIKKYPETAMMIDERTRPKISSGYAAMSGTASEIKTGYSSSVSSNTPPAVSAPSVFTTQPDTGLAASAGGQYASTSTNTPHVPTVSVSAIGILIAQSANHDGFRVVSVNPDTPADMLGMESGDVILEFGNRSMKDVTTDEFLKILDGYKSDTAAPVKFSRNGSTCNGRILAGLSEDVMMDYRNDKKKLDDAVKSGSTNAVEEFILDNPRSLARRQALKALVDMAEQKPDRDAFYSILTRKYPEVGRIIERRKQERTDINPVVAQPTLSNMPSAVSVSGKAKPEIGQQLNAAVNPGVTGASVATGSALNSVAAASAGVAAASLPMSGFFKGKSYALLIAVQDYTDESVNDLNFPINDAEALKQVLISKYTFSPENVILLKNPDRDRIIQTLGELRHKIRSGDDSLLVFYAGHGYWDEDLKQGFWIPSDASLRNEAKWLSNSTLKDYVRGIKTRHTLVISDACFSGALFKSRDAFLQPPKAVQEVYKMMSRKAITSGAMKTVPDKSVFIEYLLKRLRENADRYIDAQSLFASMKAAVINNSPVHQTPLYGTIQEAGDEGGDFVFEKR